MTASVVARLVDRHALRWDETLAEALPEIAAKMDPAFKTVTLDMLMRHVAGLPTGGAFTPEFTAGFDDEHWPIAKQRAWMAERFLSRPPKEAPGTRFAYSNYGYLILGHVVERAAGKTWEELIRQEVFAPLGMTGCGFGPTATDGAPRWHLGARREGRRLRADRGGQPAADRPRRDRALPARRLGEVRRRARGIRPRRLADAGRRSPTCTRAPRWRASLSKDIALGWGVTRTDPPRLTHAGSNGYNDAEIVVIPRLHAAVLVTCNAGDDRANAAAKEVADALVSELVKP